MYYSTIDMEPLSDQQKEFFKSYLDDTRTHMEEERREERKLMSEERKLYEKTISRMKTQLEEMREDYLDLRRSRSNPVAELTSQKHAFETPKVQRPQDKAYQEILTASKQQFHQDETPTYSFRNHDPTITQQNEMMKIYDIRMTNLMTSMGSILKYSKKEDTTELPKFQGGDSQWPK